MDISEKFTNLGKKYWKLANVEKKIDLKLNDAIDTLDELLKDKKNHDSFDFAFIDADKVNYPVYYEKILKLLRKGGWMAFDNALAFGYANKEESEVPLNSRESVKAIKGLNLKAKNDKRVTVSFVEISDGLNLIVKK